MGFAISRICRTCGGEIKRRPAKRRFGVRRPMIEWRCTEKKCSKSKQWNASRGERL